MPRPLSKPAILILLLLALAAFAVVTWSIRERHRYDRQLALFVLQARAAREYSTGQQDAMSALEAYEQALLHASDADLGVSRANELLMVHLKKAVLFHQASDEQNFTAQRQAALSQAPPARASSTEALLAQMLKSAPGH